MATWPPPPGRPSRPGRGSRSGFIQGPGGALPGSLSRDVSLLRDRGLLDEHITAGPCHGGDHEAVTVAGAIDAAASELDWSVAIVGPGPGIQGSESRYGHGGMAAFDAANASLGLGWPTLLSPRLSSSDPRPRHRGLSHHSQAVLEMLRSPVRVPVPEASIEGWPVLENELEGGSPQAALDDLIQVCGGRHDIAVQPRSTSRATGERPARPHDGPDDRRGPALLRRRAGRRARAGRGHGARVKRVGSKVVYEGPVATVRVDTFRYEDGAEEERQVVGHPGAVAVVAHDDEHIYLVRQPREAVGEPALLELPAGKLDVEGETPLECARRELAEEISMEASEWTELKRFYTSPGFAEEEVTRVPRHRPLRCRRRPRPRRADRGGPLAARRSGSARSPTAATRSR